LTDFCPLYQQPGSQAAVSQFDKDDVEAAGLVKFDFLGLATLTILEMARSMIVERNPAKSGFAFEDIALDDATTYKLFSDGKTEAVFQFESRGMQGMLRDARPTRLEDLIALNALYRPGPMDLIPSCVARKHGREAVAYPHPLVEAVLSETYGIMVYQEQVMQTAQILGGYSLGGADLLRRAMGKKKAEEMAQHRQIFADGAAKNGITEPKANEIFDLMESFAGYGFNKSHAAAYALLAYQTAWLKAYYPAEFMAANLSLAMDDTDKVKILYDDCLANQIRVFSPDINTGVYEFTPLRAPDAAPDSPISHIRYGLGAVRGTGEAAIESIVKARETGGPFKDLFDFCARVDRRQVNRRAIEALMRAGAFDSLYRDSVPAGGNLYDIRSTLLASLARAIEAAEQAEASIHQVSLFDIAGEEDRHLPELVREPVWSEKKRLQEEKTALGLCLTGHMFDAYRDEAGHFIRQPLAKVAEG
jgi:DNA polymerase-3 subunit alpha